MSNRRILLYFAWSRPAETGAPLAVIDDRFPAVFELRRLFYPRFESLSGRDDVDQGIGGLLDHIQKPNFAGFAEQDEALTGNPIIQVERVSDDGVKTPLDDALIADADTIVVISFDSFRTSQVRWLRANAASRARSACRKPLWPASGRNRRRDSGAGRDRSFPRRAGPA